MSDDSSHDTALDRAVAAASLSPAWAARMRALTPARVALERTGVSLETSALLDFQRSHAQARDAVHSRLEASSLAAGLSEVTGGPVLRLHSAAGDRATYLQRPDLGRKLDDASRQLLLSARTEATPSTSLALIVADGLSALAVERHALPLIRELLPRLHDWTIATSCVVEQARVAIGDEIGADLNAQLSIVLIGERPGLSSPDSLGAYITWNPRPGRTDAERNCISNIRAEGLSYAQAAGQLVYYLNEARRRQLTGVQLKDEAPRLASPQSAQTEPASLRLL
jgi:ethanolamine ammonia-lyase small subunit